MAKRKSLMDALNEYQKENKSGPYAKGAVRGQGPTRDGGTYGKLLRKNKQEDSGGPRGVLAPKHGGKPPTAPPPVSRGGGSNSGSSSDSGTSKARQQTTVTRSNRNKTDAGGMRNTGGRGTTPQATPAKPKRTDFGPGRSGAAAYNRAVTQWRKKNSTSTPSTPAGQRSGRRGQGGRK
jgi:hypothetical protein